MDRNMVLKSYREVDTEVNVTREEPGKAPVEFEFSTEFCALGRDNSYHFGYDFNTETRFLAIGAQGDKAETALKTGTIVPIGQQIDIDQGYNRALLIERAILGGLPLEDSIRLTEAVQDYAALDAQLTGEPVKQNGLPAKPAQDKPAFEMLLQKR